VCHVGLCIPLESSPCAFVHNRCRSRHSFSLPGSLSCRICPPGRYGATSGVNSTQCTGPCQPGYYCREQSTSPVANACPPGRYSLVGAAGCNACPPGRFGATSAVAVATCTGVCIAGCVLTCALLVIKLPLPTMPVIDLSTTPVIDLSARVHGTLRAVNSVFPPLAVSACPGSHAPRALPTPLRLNAPWDSSAARVRVCAVWWVRRICPRSPRVPTQWRRPYDSELPWRLGIW
jgi:hypothetical protein